MTDGRRVSKPLAFGISLADELSENDSRRGGKTEKESEDIEIHTISRVDKIENGDLSLDQTIKKLLKSMDANRYATKKTLAQGMLDIALLTTNASQLKYMLQVGHRHAFYTLMLYLISASIGLQVIQGLICVFLGSGVNINREQDHKKANRWNDICMCLMVVTVAVNVLISAFEMRDIDMLVESVGQNKLEKYSQQGGQ